MKTPPLLSEQIHVWRVELDTPASWIRMQDSPLDADEQARAERFHDELHRRRFIAAHTAVRWILADYLHRAPAELRFSFGAHGKPAVVGSEIHFNLSHAGGLMLVAVAHLPLGIDVEEVRPSGDEVQIARSQFSAEEQRAWHQLPPHQRTAGFFRCWVCKEAYLKARGQGLSLALDSFDVVVDPSLPAQLLATRPDSIEADRWSLYDLPMQGPVLAALAVQRSQATRCEISIFDPE